PLEDTITDTGRPTMADAPAPHHTLVFQFVAALLQRTLGCPTVEAHQHALQGFLDTLTPWITPVELPTLLEQPFTLFDHLTFTPRGDDDEDVCVTLSPGGKIVFRVWLRQRGLDPLVCSS
ncbi:MAG TPA: hypothetical protein VLQ80_17770, partial [Candidatus Saccharimonadia bacterium]|nr:hypothetical protein [Candidatus Saccharimonadia bacterium]